MCCEDFYIVGTVTQIIRPLKMSHILSLVIYLMLHRRVLALTSCIIRSTHSLLIERH